MGRAWAQSTCLPACAPALDSSPACFPTPPARLTSRSNKPVYTLRFIQTPAVDPANRKKTPEYVYIHLILLRLKEQQTDIMVTVNIPHYAGEYEKPKEGESDATPLMKGSEAIKSRILESFNIKDWGLFEG
jgi:hypothetical protein